MKNSPPSTHKKVVLHKLDNEVIKGYVTPNSYLGPNGVEVLDREGRGLTIPLEELKAICFVRDFDGNPNRPERKTFMSRPKQRGLWLRMTFRDNEVLEGLSSTNLLEWDPRGFTVTPPDTYSNNLKLFIPRPALATVEVLGVISNSGSRRAARQAAEGRPRPSDQPAQLPLFPPTTQAEIK